MEEINVNVTDIDGKEYRELDTVEVKDSKYVYLVSTKEETKKILEKYFYIENNLNKGGDKK